MRLAQGPAATASGGHARGQLRRAVLRAMRPFTAYQASVNADRRGRAGRAQPRRRRDPRSHGRGVGRHPGRRASRGGPDDGPRRCGRGDQADPHARDRSRRLPGAGRDAPAPPADRASARRVARRHGAHPVRAPGVLPERRGRRAGGDPAARRGAGPVLRRVRRRVRARGQLRLPRRRRRVAGPVHGGRRGHVPAAARTSTPRRTACTPSGRGSPRATSRRCSRRPASPRSPTSCRSTSTARTTGSGRRSTAIGRG